MSKPGNVWVDFAVRKVAFDDGIAVRHVAEQTIANVKSDYGAIGDGDFDDQPALQAAFNSGFSRVYLPKGVYKILDVLTIPSGLTVEGDGDETVIDGTSLVSPTGTEGILQMTGGGFSSLGSPNANPAKYGRTLSFAAAPSVSPGDILCIYNPTDYSFSGFRTYYREGEYAQVRDVSGTTINLVAPLYSGYTAANVTVYKMVPFTGTLRNLRVRAPLSLNFVPVIVTYGAHVEIENISADGSDYGEVLLQNCYNVSVSKVDLRHLQTTAGGLDYGVVVVNSQHVRVSDSYLVARRHGFVVGGGAAVGSVPNRDVRLINSTAITTSADEAGAIDFHGNSEWCEIVDCHVEGGINLGGDNITVRGGSNRCAGQSGALIYFAEMLGWNFTVDGMQLYSNGGTSTRGCAIDLGGNSTPADDKTVRGGTLNFRNLKMVDENGTASAPQFIRVRNRGSTASYRLTIDNVEIDTADDSIGTLFVDTVSGSSPKKVTIRKLRGNYVSINLDDMANVEIDSIDAENTTPSIDCVNVQVVQNNSLLEIKGVTVRNPVLDGISATCSGSPTGCVARIDECTVFNTVSTYYGIEIATGWAVAFMTGCYAAGAGTNLRMASLTKGIAIGNSEPISAASVTTLLQLAAPSSQPGAYSPSNVTTDRAYNANSTTIDELADVLGTLIADLQTWKVIG